MIRKHFNSRWPSIVTWTVGYFTLHQVRPANIGTNQYELMMPALDSMFQWLIFFSYFWINRSHKFSKNPDKKQQKTVPSSNKIQPQSETGGEALFVVRGPWALSCRREAYEPRNFDWITHAYRFTCFHWMSLGWWSSNPPLTRWNQHLVVTSSV